MKPIGSSRIAALLVALTGTVGAQSKPQDPAPANPRLGAAAEAESDARLAKIREEITRLGDEPGWAGRYYRGDGTGVNVNVDLAPEAGFVFTLSGCLGVYDRNFGTVSEKVDRLALTFAFPDREDGPRLLAPVLVPVTWGERHYLVATREMRAFVNQVNSGGEPRLGVHGGFLLRLGDEARPVEGAPRLPAEFAKLLLDEPITGTILQVLESRVEAPDPLGYRISELLVDRGGRHGIWQGMALYIDGAGFGSAQGTVIAFDDRTARVRVRAMFVKDPPAVPAVGSAWSTRPAGLR